MKIAIFPGDGIGPEIIIQAIRVLEVLRSDGLKFELEMGLLGGCAVDATGEPFPEGTRKLAIDAEAVLLGAVGGPQYDMLLREKRPERGLLDIRKALNLFANLRPITLHRDLINASTLKPEIILGLNILIVRELTGDIYFGEPRGIEWRNNQRVGFNTMIYSETEISRIAHVAFQAARKRNHRLCSIDKMNVLECTQLWRDVLNQIAKEYPDVELSHMLVDNAAMQLVREPKQFDVIVTGNLFGDILSDEASMLTGSIGMLPSASLDNQNKGLYEPIHGSAPDIAGKDMANPLAMILSVAMMLRYTFNLESSATRIEHAVKETLAQGYRTNDIFEPGMKKVGTAGMGDAVLVNL
ncbi:MAG: 3-isopropylmalate dehydrogenase [Nitrosospira sp.]|nr:3-isopropylmalate dehydrogenase [Nitrosospira sp.]MDW7643068.1 3-isopropylmalate dehydrogenase [Nitrosomonadaceae bacterium]MBI0407380.1 3-isopropylmalate dehydrogenase [Nitrosospira sp.]MBI0414386.1 3-isopropylmalate dehydrogenase [Nitrosospira sp.]MBI0415586.1 3-isopropylmalate dehydrogenase [Nitrosospira sp.]